MTRAHRGTLVGFLIVSACTSPYDDDPGQNAAPSPSREALGTIDAAIAALGGEAALTAVDSLLVRGTLRRFEPGQTVHHDDPPLVVPEADFSLLHQPKRARFRFDFDRRPNEPFFLPFRYSSVVDRDRGLIAGSSDIAAGMTGSTRRAMFRDRLAATNKIVRLTEPAGLLLAAKREPGMASPLPAEVLEGRPHDVVALRDAASPIRIFLDAATHLPTRVDTMEDDPVLGDVRVEVQFDGWSHRSGLVAPAKVVTRVAGMVIEEQSRDGITPNGVVDEATFDTSVDGPPDDRPPQRGEARSHWFGRYDAVGLDVDPLPAPFDAVDIAEMPAGSKIFHVTGKIHHSLVVEMEKTLVIVEAPVDDARSLAVIDAVSKRFPGKPISHLVTTHHHHDHTGGVRTYVARGAKVVAAEQNALVLQRLVAAPHTILPDTLAKAPRPLDFVPVGSRGVDIVDGRTVRVVPIETAHSEAMVMVYVPDAKLLFQSDLYAPNHGPADRKLENPPIPRLLVTGMTELLDGIAAKGLDVRWILGGHGFGLASLEQLKINAGRPFP